MLYATREDMIATFGEEDVIRLTDTNDAPGVVDEAALGRALERVSVEIDGYVASRYPMPFDPVPRILLGIACDLARYRLTGTGGRLVTDEIRDRHKDAIGLLKMIARGDVKLGADTAGQLVEPQDSVQMTAGMPGSGALHDALKDYP